ncbi:hypothetical protein MRX96_055890 [Rhipicephalus microplus]
MFSPPRRDKLSAEVSRTGPQERSPRNALPGTIRERNIEFAALAEIATAAPFPSAVARRAVDGIAVFDDVAAHAQGTAPARQIVRATTLQPRVLPAARCRPLCQEKKEGIFRWRWAFVWRSLIEVLAGRCHG